MPPGTTRAASQATTREVTTTRVEVVEGIGREGGFDPGQIYSQLSPGVVTVISLFGPTSRARGRWRGRPGLGVPRREGYIATNAHVVTKEDDTGGGARVRAVPGRQSRAGEIVGADLNADFALLKSTRDSTDAAPLGERGTPWDAVAAIGKPVGEAISLSVEVVSALTATSITLTRFGIGDAIQTDAAINPGNSGGPLLDARGAGDRHQRPDQVAVRAAARSLRDPGRRGARSLAELREDGRVEYGYLGVRTVLLWPQLAERLGIEAGRGALVQDVEPGSPAEDEGLDPKRDDRLSGPARHPGGRRRDRGRRRRPLTQQTSPTRDRPGTARATSRADRGAGRRAPPGADHARTARWKRPPAPRCGFRGDPGRVTAVVRTTDAADSRDVSLTIPARPDYLVLARLAALAGVPTDAASPEEVADLKLAITEAANDYVDESRPLDDESRPQLLLQAGRRPAADGSRRARRPDVATEQELSRAIIEATVDKSSSHRAAPAS